MNFAIRLLLITALAFGPAACNRNNAPDESVSANADRTARSDQTQPKDAVKERKVERERQSARETRPAYRAPEREPSRPVETERTRMSETVPTGTAVRVTLADMISTENVNVGDKFTAHLSQPIVVNGKVVADKGDQVMGHVTKVDEPGRVKGRARLELVLDEIQTSGKVHKVSTEPFIAVASDNHKRDATEIAGGAAVGAAVGAITGGKKGAAIGAVIGGGTGTTAVLLTKGEQLELAPETKVNFVLSRDVDLPVIRNSNT